MTVYRVVLVQEHGGTYVDALLREAGFDVERARCRNLASRLRSIRPDLVLMDSVGCLCSSELCLTIRRDPALSRTALVVLSDSANETDTVLALELGADDYIAMPVGSALLCARIEAVLRRLYASRPSMPAVELGRGLRIPPGRASLVVDGISVSLTPVELSMLLLLAGSPNTVLNRESILKEVKPFYRTKQHSVDALFTSLRRKLRSQRDRLEAVSGGYRFRLER
jgi:DNA-binding response OmpR family regulator